MNTNLSIDISFVPNWKTDIQNLITAINNLDGVKVADVSLEDLMFDSDHCHGIYLFQEGKNYHVDEQNQSLNPYKYWYIGCCAGCSFADRIGRHLDPHYDGFMNGVLKNIAWLLSGIKRADFFNKSLHTPIQKQTYMNKAFPIIQDLRLKIVCFDNKYDIKTDIKLTEDALIKLLPPYFNYPNRNKSRKLSLKP